MTSDNNYFSWQNFNEVAKIDSHMQFAEQLINDYQWNDEERKPLVDAMQRIRDKQQDRCLNVSVVGEFSSGKSTFINALLRQDLLEADVLQGTTVAITILEYSAHYHIRSEYEDGTSSVKHYDGLLALRHELTHLTTDSTEGKQLKCVYVGLPSPTLRRGFRIIDTPGTNAIELWHEEVTKRAINEYSDMSILVTDAIKPMPKTTIDFARQYLGKNMANSVVVVTKLDMLCPKERKRQMEYIEKKVKHNFADTAPLVLNYTSIEVLNTFVPDTLENSDANLLAWTMQSEERLLNHTAELRLRSLAHRLLRLTGNMYSTLARQLEEEEVDILIEQEELEKAKHTDFTEFIRLKKISHSQRVMRKANEIKSLMEIKLHNHAEASKMDILAKIEEKKTASDLKKYVKNELQSDCEKQAERLHNVFEQHFSDQLMFVHNEIKEFQKEFQKEFEDLNILSFSIDFDKEKNVPMKGEWGFPPLITEGGLTNALVPAPLRNASLSSVGTALGNMILPVKRTVVSGISGFIEGSSLAPKIDRVRQKVLIPLKPTLNSYFSQVEKSLQGSYDKLVGFIGGSFLAPNVDRVRQKILIQLRPTLNSYFLHVKKSLLDSYDELTSNILTGMSNEIDKYHSCYLQEVKRREAEWDKKRMLTDKRMAKLREDQSILIQRKNSLEIIKEKLSRTK